VASAPGRDGEVQDLTLVGRVDGDDVPGEPLRRFRDEKERIG